MTCLSVEIIIILIKSPLIKKLTISNNYSCPFSSRISCVSPISAPTPVESTSSPPASQSPLATATPAPLLTLSSVPTAPDPLRLPNRFIPRGTACRRGRKASCSCRLAAQRLRCLFASGEEEVKNPLLSPNFQGILHIYHY